jgi:hypothetical protein
MGGSEKVVSSLPCDGERLHRVDASIDHPNPELFTGLIVSMVFFPVIAWMTIDPLFKRN